MKTKLCVLLFFAFLFLGVNLKAAGYGETAVGYSYLMDDGYHAGGFKLAGNIFFGSTAGVGLMGDFYFYKVDDESIGENPLFIHMTFSPHLKLLLGKAFFALGPGYEWVRYKVYGLTQNDTRAVLYAGTGFFIPSFMGGGNSYIGLDYVSSMDFKFKGSRIAVLLGWVF